MLHHQEMGGTSSAESGLVEVVGLARSRFNAGFFGMAVEVLERGSAEAGVASPAPNDDDGGSTGFISITAAASTPSANRTDSFALSFSFWIFAGITVDVE